MGRIVVAARFWNSRQDEAVDAGASAPLVRNCIVDTGATMTVIPQAVVSQLGLRLRGAIRVKYANGRTAWRNLAQDLVVEIEGQEVLTEAIVEPGVRRPLIGAIVLERLDLVADCKNRRLIRNPDHPEGPVMEILAASGESHRV